ncbi:DUF7344 domain-containing protein [Halostagnicola kamekurae]|uniref:DUF7344 domain-containing protein n=1 Tax=Halostagnicola kamekurae TaxID=619731 RepID=A0A1I6Q5Y0_9EURY|nr:hypothetical protein [Halostagnicola kamekurae]SFS47866.1 hypothetical protein SAMN04488556_1006 [Halostagnicola kamekurae]
MSTLKQQQPERTDTQYRGGENTRIGRETAYQALSNKRRRFIVHYLLRERTPVSLRTLSKQVAAWENAVPPSQVTSKQRKRAYTALHQAHLPKLDKMGIIEYDTREMVAHPTAKLETLQVYIDVVPEDDVPWSVFYIGIAFVFGASATLGWLGLPPFGLFPGHLWALIGSLTVAAMGAVHTYRDRRHEFAIEAPPPEVERSDSR